MLCTLLASWLCLPAMAASQCAGVRLPARADVFGLQLQRNGVGLREATFLNIDVYVAGLYVEHPSRDVHKVLDQREPKAILLHFVRDVSRSEMIDAMNKALKDNLGAGYAKVRPHMRKFVSRLPELHKGTQLLLAYRPSHGIELRVNGKSLGVDRDDVFGNLVFLAWLGHEPPDADLKRGLLGGPCD